MTSALRSVVYVVAARYVPAPAIFAGCSIRSRADGVNSRQGNVKAEWLRKIQRIMKAYPDCLAVAIDYHD